MGLQIGEISLPPCLTKGISIPMDWSEIDIAGRGVLKHDLAAPAHPLLPPVTTEQSGIFFCLRLYLNIENLCYGQHGDVPELEMPAFIQIDQA